MFYIYDLLTSILKLIDPPFVCVIYRGWGQEYLKVEDLDW